MKTTHSLYRLPRGLHAMVPLLCAGLIATAPAEDTVVVAEFIGNATPKEMHGTTWVMIGREAYGTLVGEPEDAYRIWRGLGNEGGLNVSLQDADALLSDLRGKRWRLSARVRLDLSEQKEVRTNAASMGIILKEPNEEFAFNLCYDEENQQAYAKINRQNIKLFDVDVERFHDYALEFDPASNSVLFSVNGEVIGEATSANPVNENVRLFWGQRSTNSPAASEWAWVKLEILE
jgi:hypothetical protein